MAWIKSDEDRLGEMARTFVRELLSSRRYPNQTALGEALGIDQSHVSALSKAGSTRGTTAPVLLRAAKLLGREGEAYELIESLVEVRHVQEEMQKAETERSIVLSGTRENQLSGIDAFRALMRRENQADVEEAIRRVGYAFKGLGDPPAEEWLAIYRGALNALKKELSAAASLLPTREIPDAADELEAAETKRLAKARAAK